MKVVYIAGPFRGKNAWEVEQNIRRVEKLGFQVAQLGASPLMPHTNTRFFDGTLDDRYWLEATLELMRRCDAVLFTADWMRSTGAQEEEKEARRLGIARFFKLEDLAQWLA